MQDSNQNVRMNAHLVLANMKPLPSVEAIDALTDSLHSREIRAAGSASVALARLSATVPKALQVLTASIDAERNPERLVALVYGIGEAKTPGLALVQAVTAKLEHGDSRVVFAALDCLGKLGPPAKSALPAVRRIVSSGGTPGSLRAELVDAAKTALSRIGSE